MYTAALILHSWLRWSALIAGVGATFMALTDREGLPRRPASAEATAARRSFSEGGSDNVAKADARADRWGLALMVALDLQMLAGLLLYFLVSPITREAMRDFGAAMANPGLRFFAVEHIAVMLVAVVLAHVGRILGRKAPTPAAKRKRLIMCFGVATLLMLIATPWPGMANGRPLFRVS